MGLLNIHRSNVHHEKLVDDYMKYNHSERMKSGDRGEKQFSSALTHFQPVVAWIGLAGCLSIVLVFSNASIWNGKVTVVRVVAAYIGVSDTLAGFSAHFADCYQPLTLLLMWLALKVYSRRSWVKLDNDWGKFSEAIGRLEYLIEEGGSSNDGGAPRFRPQNWSIFRCFRLRTSSTPDADCQTLG